MTAQKGETVAAPGGEVGNNLIGPSSNLHPLSLSSSPYAPGTDTNRAIAEEAPALPSTACKRPARNAVTSVAVIDEHSFTREATTKSLRQACKLLDIVSFATCDLFLNSEKKYDVVLYCEHDNILNRNYAEVMLSNIKKLLPKSPVILLCDLESFELMRIMFDNGVRGYIPTASTTLEVAVEIIYLVKAGGIFVPPSSLSLPRCSLSISPDPIAVQKFTPRQIAVLDHLKLGQTNKVIAFKLNISQSSVKAHIQNIMKKMNANNRTEVVYLAQELVMKEIHTATYESYAKPQ